MREADGRRELVRGARLLARTALVATAGAVIFVALRAAL